MTTLFEVLNFCMFVMNVLMSVPTSSSSFCVNYGQLGDNLPTPIETAHRLRTIGVTEVKIYDSNPQIIQALANTKIKLTVTLENERIIEMNNLLNANVWFTNRIEPYLNETDIIGIMIGNEVLSAGISSIASALVTTMVNFNNVIIGKGLQHKITISTTNSLGVLDRSFPPSEGTFKSDQLAIIAPMLKVLDETSSDFMLNAYPYFAYLNDRINISLGYALGQGDITVLDTINNKGYHSLLTAQSDATSAAIRSLGYNTINVKISETGWPSQGGDQAANTDNAARYYKSLLTGVTCTYAFALYDENLKPGPESERHFGLFTHDGIDKYVLFENRTKSEVDDDPNMKVPPVTIPSMTGMISITTFLFWISIFVTVIQNGTLIVVEDYLQLLIDGFGF